MSATVGNLFASSLDGWFIFRQQTVDSAAHRESGRVPAADVAGEHPVHAARLPATAEELAVVRRVRAATRRAGGGDRPRLRREHHLHALARPASAGEPRLRLRRDERAGRRRVLLRQLRRVRQSDDRQPALPSAAVARARQSCSSTAPISRSTRRAATPGGCELEHASQITVSDYSYNRLFGAGDAVHAARASGATCSRTCSASGSCGRTSEQNGDAVLHPSKRFYAGGSQSVRGFGENQLGPRILTLPHGFLTYARTADGGLCDANSPAIRLCDPNTARDSTGDAPSRRRRQVHAAAARWDVAAGGERGVPLPAAVHEESRRCGLHRWGRRRRARRSIRSAAGSRR